MPADAPLAGECLIEERLDEGSNRRHDCLNRQDAADMLQGCRLLVFEEAEEGLDGRQPHIARHRRVFAVILEMLQIAGASVLVAPCRERECSSTAGRCRRASTPTDQRLVPIFCGRSCKRCSTPRIRPRATASATAPCCIWRFVRACACPALRKVLARPASAWRQLGAAANPPDWTWRRPCWLRSASSGLSWLGYDVRAGAGWCGHRRETPGGGPQKRAEASEA